MHSVYGDADAASGESVSVVESAEGARELTGEGAEYVRSSSGRRRRATRRLVVS